MTFRQANAPQLFYGLFEGETKEGSSSGGGGSGPTTLLGFVNGTCCVEEELHHATMSQCVRVRVRVRYLFVA
jgi:hypothetical protein